MTPADKAHIEEIRAREKAATPGPWKADWEFCDPIRVRSAKDNAVATVHGDENGDNAVFDSFFVAQARTDVPYLLDLVERQARMIERARKGLEGSQIIGDDGEAATEALIELEEMECGKCLRQ